MEEKLETTIMGVVTATKNDTVVPAQVDVLNQSVTAAPGNGPRSIGCLGLTLRSRTQRVLMDNNMETFIPSQ